MPLKYGPPRECTSEARCGVAIGQFRNANNRQTCGPPSALYKGTSRYQRAPGARNLSSKFVTHRREILKWPDDCGSQLNR